MVFQKTTLAWTLTLIFSLITGYINMTSTENLPPMLCILVFPCLVGLIEARSAWRWGLVIGLSIMLSQFFALAINYKILDAPRFPITLAILVIPALVAAYAGALVSHLTRPSNHQMA